MYIKNYLRIIGVLLLLTFSEDVYSQLSKTHYIPPLTSAANGNANPESQYIYISTPNNNPIPYTIKPVGLPETSYITGVVSNTVPREISIGSGNGQLFVPSTQTSTVMNKGYIIEAEDVVYVSIRMNAGGGAQAGALVSKGMSALGNTFRVGSFTNENPQDNYLNFVSVMATEDNTSITFDDLPSGINIKNYNGTLPITVLLDEGESYVVATNSFDTTVNRDGLIGTLVKSTKPIVVNCGSANGSFHNGGGRDYGIDQIVDASKIGDKYIFVKGNGNNEWENILIVAHENNTAVYINGGTVANATLSAGDYYLIEGNKYNSKGNLYVETSKPVFAYQGVGATTSEANQGLFFVPPLSCENRGNVNNIAQIQRIGSTSYTGGITIVTKKDAVVTINDQPMSNFSTTGPNNVDGNPDYVTYKVTGLSNNISVSCDSELYCAYFNYNGAATSGSFYSGFPSAPEINFDATFETLGKCIPNITLSATNTHNFDSFEWHFDDGNGFKPTGNSEPDLTPTEPGRYKLIGIIDCTGLTLESVEVPVSYCPDDIDNDGIIDNLDIDNDNDGIINCTESMGDVTINLQNETSPVLNFNDGSTNTTLATGKYISTSSNIDTTNVFSGLSNGSFQSQVFPANEGEGNYTLNFTKPVDVKFSHDPGNTHVSTQDEYFIVRIIPSSKNITLVDPDNQLLVDSNYDGIFETGIQQISGSEIHFRINPGATGRTPYKFVANTVEGFSFIHKSANINATSTFNGHIELTCFEKDSDNDGIEDALDYDSDNDGIPDIIEATGANYQPLSLVDADLDGLDDVFNGAQDPLDTDSDGVPDFIDLDSDNDGIFDIKESSEGLDDLNNDGVLDNAIATIGTNGWADSAESSPDSGIINFTVTDTDGDGMYNAIDNDSDEDLCLDVVEAGFTDDNNDGYLGNSAVSIDNKGLVSNGVDGYTIPNTDYIIAAPISITEQPANQNVCELSTFSISIETTAVDNLQWEVSSDGTNWSSITDNLLYQGTNTKELTIANIPIAYSGYRYRVQLEKNGNACGLTSEEAEVLIEAKPVVAPSVVLKQCDDDVDEFSAFNLSEANFKISANYEIETFTYFLSKSDAINDIDPIPNPQAFINRTVSKDIVWARVTSSFGCFEVSEIQLFVTATGIPPSFQQSFSMCDDYVDDVNNDRDGIATFNFSSVDQMVRDIFPPTQQLIIAYYRNESDALAEIDPITDLTNYRNIGYPGSQKIYIRVDSKINNDCLGFGPHIELNVEPLPTAHDITIERQCDDDQDGFFPFDTSQIENNLLIGQTDVTVNYFDENGNELPSPLPNPFLTDSQTISIRVTNNTSNAPDGPCFDETTLEFIVDDQPIAHEVIISAVCDDDENDTDGFYNFDTSTIQSELLNGQTGMEVYYFDQNGQELPSPLPNPFFTESQIVTAQVINPINQICSDSTELNFIVNPLPDFSVISPQILCITDPASSIVLAFDQINQSENYDIEWTDTNGTVLGNTPEMTISEIGTYQVRLTKTDGTSCSRTREIVVLPSEKPTITLDDISIVDDSNNNSITIHADNHRLGLGDYEYSLDDPFFGYQDTPYFDYIQPGIHTLYIQDKNGCGATAIEISIIAYPKFFTPNNDSYNDTWNIVGIDKQIYPFYSVNIFDRFGKIVAQFNSDQNGWNGMYKGQLLPSSDYWFTSELVNYKGETRIKRGHFSLIRK